MFDEKLAIELVRVRERYCSPQWCRRIECWSGPAFRREWGEGKQGVLCTLIVRRAYRLPWQVQLSCELQAPPDAVSQCIY